MRELSRTQAGLQNLAASTGKPFWQDESYDHWIRSGEELQELIDYVEGNPVKAGLVKTNEEWPWTSARVRADDKKRSSAPQWPAPNV